MKAFAYLAVDLLSVSVPFLLSLRGPWAAGVREWGRLIAAVFLVGVPFVAWDVAFSRGGVWGFNPAYLTGARLLGLPLEEVLFFVCIPFACLFIHRAVRGNPRMTVPRRVPRPLWLALAAVLMAAAIHGHAQPYSRSAFGLASLALLALAVRQPSWSGAFAVTAAIHYLPFFLVNGILTALPVVTYAPEGFLGFRLGTIPLEDAAYSLLLLLLNVWVFEALGGPARPRQEAERVPADASLRRMPA